MGIKTKCLIIAITTCSTSFSIYIRTIYRAENIQKLKSWKLTESDLNKEGIHPDLKIVTLRELISTWTIHDMIHLNQVSRVIDKHYTEDIGSWKNYVRLLNE
ncbi:MAG: hypothetical protein V3V00_00875 [Saprospiraceae bacterium]